MNNIYFIINAAASKGQCLKKFKVAEKVLLERKIDYHVLGSKYQGDIKHLVNEAIESGAECVVIVGGDGSVREAISALVYKPVLFSIFPFGTGNDLAKALEIPEDPVKAVHGFLNGKQYQIDAAKANESYFLNVAGFGFDVDVLVKTEYYKNRFSGKTSYMMGLLHALTHLRQKPIKIIADDKELKMRAILASVGNGKYIGGGMLAHPYADMSDGLLDVMAIHDTKWWKIPLLLMKFLKGKHIEHKNTTYFRAKKVEMLSMDGGEKTVQLDGEIMEMTPVVFEILPKALTIVK
jgi:YegS/Rv2252/BmrU family lipid kinase